MKFIGLDGREYSIDLGYNKFKKKTGGSSHHQKVREMLPSIFPANQFVEEFILPGSRFASNQNLRADFFIPGQNLIIEVHGKQHYEFTPVFHKDIYEFYKSRNRDEKKIEWCQVNNFDIVVLKYSETEDEWESAIRGRRNPEGHFQA